MNKNAISNLITFLLISLAIGSHLLVAVNPDSTFPALPELFSTLIFCGIALYFYYLKKKLWLSNFHVFRHEAILLCTILFNVIVIGFRAVYSLSHTPNQAWMPCKLVPVVATKVECFLQAAIIQNYGMRTFFMLLIATVLGVCSFAIARKIQGGWKILLASVAGSALLISVSGFLSIIFGIEQILPKIFMASVDRYRMTQFFSNYGWVWPYMAPGLAIALWLAVSSSRKGQRLIGLGMSSLIVLAIVLTQQRGGFLLIFGFLWVLTIFFTTVKRWSIALTLSISLILAGTIILSPLKSRLPLATMKSYRLLNKPILFDEDRLQIWQVAASLFKQKPLWGHGYASWFQLVWQRGKEDPAFGASGNVLDTAHNTILQMLVELGAIHTLLIFSLFAAIFYTVFRKNKKALRNGNLLSSLALISFLFPILVQEIDYIRPTFYIHAIFWGTLAGIPGNWHSYTQSVRNKTLARLLPKLNLILLFVSFLGIIFCVINFNFGAFAFEAHLSQPSPVLLRWLNPTASLVAFKTSEGKSYSIYSTTLLKKPMTIEWQENKALVRVVTEESAEFTLALKNGNSWFPRRQTFHFSESKIDGTRWISTQIAYPPLQSNLAISWSKNIYWWENFGGTLGRWCGKECWFLAKSCGNRDRLDFSLFAPRNDLTAAAPLSIEVTTYPLPVGGTFSGQTLANLPQPLAQQQLQLHNPEERLSVGVEGKRDVAWYLVRVGANSTLNPKTSGLSEDNRDLGVVVGEAVCSKN